MAISKRLRYEILRRDNHACRYCGGSAPNVELTVDHVTPASLGGTDAPENLVVACLDCNAGKASSSPDAPIVADVEQDALRWSAARERALAILSAERQRRNEYAERFLDYWEEFAPSFARLPDDWESGIDRFFEAGLPIEEVLDAAYIAITARHVTQRKRFSYMCGIAWNRIEKLNAATQEIVQSEDADT